MQTVILVILILLLVEISIALGIFFVYAARTNSAAGGTFHGERDDKAPEETPEKSMQEAWEKLMGYMPSGVGGFGSVGGGTPYESE